MVEIYKNLTYICVMKQWFDYYKVLDVIDSCETIEQLKSATKMLGLWYQMHKDFYIYDSTFKSKIRDKFYGLGGVNIDDLPNEKIVQKN